MGEVVQAAASALLALLAIHHLQQRQQLFDIAAACAQNTYISTGVRSEGREYGRGTEWVISMLNGHESRLYDTMRMRPNTFRELLRFCEEEGGLRSSDECPAANKLGIFLFIVTQGASYRLARECFNCSLHTVHIAFKQVLRIMRKRLYPSVVNLPPDEVPQHISSNPKFSPAFDGARGAIDGTHIPISINRGKKGVGQIPWRNRKGFISQNVLGIVDFEMNFIYALAGWEGSAHDTKVFRDAISRGLRTPGSESYYLADAGYNVTTRMLRTPYLSTRYHLKEWGTANEKPKDHKELYNLRHSSLRNVVERTFGVLKARFKILTQSRHGFSISAQRSIVYACIALHNFLNRQGGYLDEDKRRAELEGLIVEEDVDLELGRAFRASQDEASLDEIRAEISIPLWEAYQRYIEAVSH